MPISSHVTVRGHAVSDVVVRPTRDGKAVTRFRLATNESWFDREKRAWVEVPSSFLWVTCWSAALGDNVAASVVKGQPVIVTGRLRVTEYESASGTKTAVEVTADSVGHDLSRGRARFERVRRATPIEVELLAAQLPAVESLAAQPLDVADSAPGNGTENPAA